MEDKAYIIIDDNDQRQRMEQKIDNILRPDGYKIKSFFYDPNDKDFWDQNKDMDLSKFIAQILYDTKSYHINVIACDYEYSGNKFSGVGLIYHMRRAGFTCPIILYSGKEQKVARDLFKSNTDDDAKVQQLVMLLECSISRFLNRDTYPDSIIEILKKDYNFKDIVLKKLSEYQNLIIRFECGYFEGRKINDAINEIKNDSLHGNKFIGELLEFAIAYFATMNKDDGE
jgi:hypothetical protein